MRTISKELISPGFIKESIDHMWRTRTLNFYESRPVTTSHNISKWVAIRIRNYTNREDEELIRVDCDGQWKQSIVIYRQEANNLLHY
jgi:hypothetical protein